MCALFLSYVSFLAIQCTMVIQEHTLQAKLETDDNCHVLATNSKIYNSKLEGCQPLELKAKASKIPELCNSFQLFWDNTACILNVSCLCVKSKKQCINLEKKQTNKQKNTHNDLRKQLKVIYFRVCPETFGLWFMLFLMLKVSSLHR